MYINEACGPDNQNFYLEVCVAGSSQKTKICFRVFRMLLISYDLIVEKLCFSPGLSTTTVILQTQNALLQIIILLQIIKT